MSYIPTVPTTLTIGTWNLASAWPPPSWTSGSPKIIVFHRTCTPSQRKPLSSLEHHSGLLWHT